MDTATGWCRGCYRTIEEIIAWGQGSEAFKAQVWLQLAQRQKQAPFPEALRNAHLSAQQSEAV
jgi:predicted Fe-S protein YdhL (DUF1289 family)